MHESVHIYVCHHINGKFFSDDVFNPIHVGSAISENILPIIRDDSGENISSKNPEYCELTAVYWAWKNDLHADWIGLMHYRRFLDFIGGNHDIDIYGRIPVHTLNNEAIEKYGLNQDAVYDVIRKNPTVDVIIPKKWSVTNVGYKCLFDHYAHSPYHYQKDLELVRSVISELYPNDVKAFDRVMSGRFGYFTNIFILRRSIFEAYCDWLFSILFETEKRADLTNYSVQARRVFGYLGERLFSVFIESEHICEHRILELDRVFFQSQDLEGEKLHSNSYDFPNVAPENAVTVVISSDENFVPHLAALIESIKAHLSADRYLELIILDGGIKQISKALLRKQFSLGSRSGQIRFINCEGMYKNISVHMHFSTATFYRLALGDLLPNHNRALYIDCDTIVLDDLSKLFDIELTEGQVIAAAPDIIMKSFVNKGVPAMREAGGAAAGLYLRDYVGLGSYFTDYFQAGVILFDLDRYRQEDIAMHAIKDLAIKKYWFLDQDILNKYLKRQVCYIDTSWNLVNSINDICNDLDLEWREKSRQDFSSPKIVHYAGFEAKPWNNKNAPLAHYYWMFLRRTFWYESVLQKFQDPGTIEVLHVHSVVYRLLAKVWRSFPPFLRVRTGFLADIVKKVYRHVF